MTIQFGDYAKGTPHIHSIIADGLFRENGIFYLMPKIDIKPLAELFRAGRIVHVEKEGNVSLFFS